ncbi:hypothetical protein TNCV_2779521 [Trichonephila clavipes]|nr:hypothetical protein TNCV_2779521 [Trichonephila clavipes]
MEDKKNQYGVEKELFKVGVSTTNTDGRRIVKRVQTILCEGDGDDPCSEILHCSRLRLIDQPLQMAPEEASRGIEVLEAWWPNKKYAAFNPPPEIRSMEVVMYLNQKMC